MPPDDARRDPDGTDPAIARTTLSPANPEITGTLDFGQFTDTMSRLAATVCVATVFSGKERLGRTVTAVTSLSAHPPSLLVSITKGSDLEKTLASTGRFSLNLLAQGQEEIGDVFAGKREAADRFAIGNWSQWPSGQPRLIGAATAIECETAGIVELDTHCLIVGILVGTISEETEPLLWYRRGYRALSTAQ